MIITILSESAGDETIFSKMMDINRTETPQVVSVYSNDKVDVSPVVQRSIRINKGVPLLRHVAPASYEEG